MARNQPFLQEQNVERSAQQEWDGLTHLFIEADKLWRSRDCRELINPPANCDATAMYQTTSDALGAAASRWQALSSTISRDLSTSIDAFARTIDQWNPRAADKLRVIAQELLVKGFDFSGPPSAGAWGSSPKTGWRGGRN